MFIAALFIIAKIWKQTKCPPTNEWIKKMCYIYTMEYYSAIKKNEIYTYGWILSLSTRNHHNIVNLLYSNTKFKKKNF